MTENFWIFVKTKNFEKDFKKIDKTDQKRIGIFLDELESEKNPRLKGKALAGVLAGTWSYRVGNYRIIAEIWENEFKIIGLHVKHRSNVYEQRK